MIALTHPHRSSEKETRMMDCVCTKNLQNKKENQRNFNKIGYTRQILLSSFSRHNNFASTQ